MNECGCNDWMTTQRSAMLRAQGQRVPLPRAILEGANAAVCRRDFLRNGAHRLPHRVRRIVALVGQDLGGGIGPGGATDAPTRSSSRSSWTAATTASTRWCRSTRPTTPPTWRLARNIGFTDPSALLPLGGAAANPDFAWNPAATGLQSLYDAGKMAVIPAVDYSPPDLSHFHSRAFWQAGYLETDPTTGWLGRWIDQNGVKDNPLQALSVNWTLEESMRYGQEPGGGA